MFKFIDLFCWIWGFHIANKNLWWECVFASDIDKNARDVYFLNHKQVVYWDINENLDKIPKNFDVLCAWFLCQPFSKSWKQKWFEDTRWTLFFTICEIIEKHRPKIVLLENVPNLVTHNEWKTFETIKNSLENLWYDLPDENIILCPTQFWIPNLRKRIYIPCVRRELNSNNEFIKNFYKEISKQFRKKFFNFDNYLIRDLPQDIWEHKLKVFDFWQTFRNWIKEPFSFPVWLDYLDFKWDIEQFPKWKQLIIKKNMKLYEENKEFIDFIIHKAEGFQKTERKLEWLAWKDENNIFNCFIQQRPSGVRVSKWNKFATLVAMNQRQIVWKYKRYISIEEAKLLQHFPKDFILHKNEKIALKQLGNSVNVRVVQLILDLLFKTYLVWAIEEK